MSKRGQVGYMAVDVVDILYMNSFRASRAAWLKGSQTCQNVVRSIDLSGAMCTAFEPSFGLDTEMNKNVPQSMDANS